MYEFLFQNSYICDRLCGDSVEIRILSYYMSAVKTVCRTEIINGATYIPTINFAVLATKGG